MATIIRSHNYTATPLTVTSPPNSLKFLNSSPFILRFSIASPSFNHLRFSSRNLVPNFIRLPNSAASDDALELETEELQEPHLQEESTDGAINGETSEDSSIDDDKPDTDADATPTSPALTALQQYKEALDSNDEDKIAEVEAFFKSIEEEKNALERKVLSLSEDFAVERERVLRISADFDNFRKRTERERLSLVTNAQGELIENFLPVVDNFERAKSQIKIETEAEQKINNSYQSINKQFFEILSSIGVVPVETVGKPFDPMLHEAIMREESTEYDEDVIIEEYRKGFKLGDRLLRPAMVKVSAGPGPEKPQASESSVEEEGETETREVVDGEGDSEDQTTS
ncbi:hypothetical protein vseg_016501 [Gypsophila vaccaria]